MLVTSCFFSVLHRQDRATEGHGEQQQTGQGNSGAASTGPNARLGKKSVSRSGEYPSPAAGSPGLPWHQRGSA